MAFREQVLSLFRSGAAMTAAGTILATGSYVMYKDLNRFPRMQQTFARGNILAPLAENQHEVMYHPRTDIEAKLNVALRPKFTNEYYLVSGEVGSGKTRTIVEMVRQMMLESGTQKEGAPIYVLATQGKCFTETLAAAVNFFFDEHISFRFFLDFVLRIHSFPELDEHHRLVRVLDALERAAFLYMQKTGQPVVLVIDGANSLSTHACSHGVLEILQEKAKLWADTNIIKVVFVSNDEKTEMALQEHSSNWSRAAPPITIGDMTQVEATKFLMESSKLLESDVETDQAPLSLEEALDVYDLVGGRVHHLIAFKRARQLDIPFEATAEALKRKEREKFMDVSKSSTILKAIDMIKCSHGSGVPLCQLIDASSDEHVATMLKYNIIRIERQKSGMMVMFESKLTERVAGKMCSCK